MEFKVEIPAAFKERIELEMGREECAHLLAALDGDTPTSIRLNPYKIAARPEGMEGIGWSKYGFYLEERPQFTYDSAFHAGTYYVQEASSQFVGHILATASEELEGAKILDTCAAPGGKTTIYSTIVGMEGLVVAGEINRSRAQVLADNVRKWGLGNVVVVNGDAEHVSQFESFYDVVAVDAPCSGEGMFRRMEGAREEWAKSGGASYVAQCAERQSDILSSAWRALKPGGILIYSTCTFNRSENEELVAAFEQSVEGEVAEFDDVAVDDAWGVVKGCVGSFQTFRFMPHRSRGEGFFAAVARKSFDAGGRQHVPKSKKSMLQSISRNDFAECCRWVEQPERMSFSMVGENIYGYFTAQLDSVRKLADTLNVIYSGVTMGQIFKGALSPDEALALFVGLNREAVACAVLNDRDEMLSYLRKGDVPAERFEQGMNLVVDCNGYGVGFAKRIGARVNNRYPNSLRILK
ncbi:MAG: rRNA cytosine-C5-methylase [Rikenellaceae bacterium]